MLRHQESSALVQGAGDQIPIHRPYSENLSKGEYNSVKAAVGSMEALIDENSKAYEKHFIKYLASKDAVEEKLLEHGELYKTPIVRNGRQATVGYCPDIWKTWE